MTQETADKLAAALTTRFGGDVEAEMIGNGRYRFAILSTNFDKVPHMQRQDDAWAEVDRVVDRNSILDISLILTYAPGDLDLVNESH